MSIESERDEFDGVGGSYKVDKKTGKRVLVERTEDAPEVKQPETVKDILKGEQ